VAHPYHSLTQHLHQRRIIRHCYVLPPRHLGEHQGTASCAGPRTSVFQPAHLPTLPHNIHYTTHTAPLDHPGRKQLQLIDQSPHARFQSPTPSISALDFEDTLWPTTYTAQHCHRRSVPHFRRRPHWGRQTACSHAVPLQRVPACTTTTAGGAATHGARVIRDIRPRWSAHVWWIR
jgi:hypothetical protein